MGTNEIGRLISDNIHEYIRTANDKILDEIFRSLVVVGSRILRDGYRKEVDSYILDEINYEAAESNFPYLLAFICRKALLRSGPTDR
jgi:hypothetical protein